MFEIERRGPGLIAILGRFDAAQAPKAEDFLSAISDSTRIDMSELEYISSAGISVIIKTYKRLDASGLSLTLMNPSPRVLNIFRYAGLDQVMTIE